MLQSKHPAQKKRRDRDMKQNTLENWESFSGTNRQGVARVVGWVRQCHSLKLGLCTVMECHPRVLRADLF